MLNRIIRDNSIRIFICKMYRELNFNEESVTPVFYNIGVSIMHKKIREKLNKPVRPDVFFQGIVPFFREKTLYCRYSDILNRKNILIAPHI